MKKAQTRVYGVKAKACWEFGVRSVLTFGIMALDANDLGFQIQSKPFSGGLSLSPSHPMVGFLDVWILFEPYFAEHFLKFFFGHILRVNHQSLILGCLVMQNEDLLFASHEPRRSCDVCLPVQKVCSPGFLLHHGAQVSERVAVPVKKIRHPV